MILKNRVAFEYWFRYTLDMVMKQYTPMDESTIFELQVTAEKMYNALKVLLESEKLKSLLEVNDHMAFRQCRNAMQVYEDNLFHI
jgi:hypothetical protein